MKALTKMLSESDSTSKISSMRVAVFMVLGIVMATYLAHNIIAMVNGQGMVSLGWNEVTTIAAILGAKAVQRKSESKKDAVVVTSTQSTGGVSVLSDDKMPKEG